MSATDIAPARTGRRWRQATRVVSILATSGFWLLSAHLFGVKAAFYVSAAYMFGLSIKDLSYVRVRLLAIQNPETRRQAVWVSIAIEMAIMVLRLIGFAAVAALLRLFNPIVAVSLEGLALSALFWTRETLGQLIQAYNLGRAIPFLSLARALSGLAVLWLLARLGWSVVDAAAAALLAREATAFAGFFLVAMAGRLGWRGVAGSAGGIDDDEDIELGASVMTPDDSSVGPRTARIVDWRRLVADNMRWSRWRFIEFSTKHAAGGLLGPFGTIGTKLVFALRKPNRGRASRRGFSPLTAAAYAAVGVAVIASLFHKRHRHTALHAVGTTGISLLSRLAALALNAFAWQRLGHAIGIRTVAEVDVALGLGVDIDTPSVESAPTIAATSPKAATERLG